MKPITLETKSIDFLKTCATKIAGPQNRLILGATALATQPFIDYYNKNVDEKTRKFSVCNTLSKIIVGTTTGVIVRALAIKYSAKALNLPYIQKTFSEAVKNPKTKQLLQTTIGDISALGVCLFSNFIIDAPLTKMLTTKLSQKFIKEEKQQ